MPPGTGLTQRAAHQDDGKPEKDSTIVNLVCSHLQGCQELNTERNRLLSPFEIFFSQNHIRPEFQDGRSIDAAVGCIGSRRFDPRDGFEDLGCPQKSSWWLLSQPFPMIEVIQWRIKLREEDGCQVVDDDGNELYGEREWYTLDNRRLYCLQRAAVALYPKQVRVLVSVVHQEEGSCREFRKFRSVDRGRSIRLGHRDSPDLPRWCWRLEVGLAEEVLPAGSALPRRRDGRGSAGRPARRKNDRDPADSGEDQAWGSHLANASLFVLVYATMRLLFALWRHYSSDERRQSVTSL